ncbi:hypothetical protein LTR95_011571 [Oleoguttula sp. CCFEE 5521]
MIGFNVLRKAMWLEYDVVPSNAGHDSDSGSEDDGLEDGNAEDEGTGQRSREVTTNSLVGCYTTPELLMLGEFEVTGREVVKNGGVELFLQTYQDFHYWFDDYEYWMRSAVSWERTLIHDSPVSIDVVMSFGNNIDIAFKLERDEGDSTVGRLVQKMVDHCYVWEENETARAERARSTEGYMSSES